MKKPSECLHMMLERAKEIPSPNSHELKMYNPAVNLEARFRCGDCGTLFFEMVVADKKQKKTEG